MVSPSLITQTCPSSQRLVISFFVLVVVEAWLQLNFVSCRPQKIEPARPSRA
jgi:hypothetical protein